MKKKYILLLSAFIFLLGAAQGDSDFYFKMSRGMDIFGNVYKQINLKYVDQIDPEKFMINGIDGMLSSLDPYTVFIDANQQQDISLYTKGKYGGIGASVGIRDQQVVIMDLIEGYSAQRQGLRIGDIILEVDSTKVSADNYDVLSRYMKGEPGSSVTIKIKRNGFEDALLFNLIREEVVIHNLTFADFYPENSNNVYLKLSGFTVTAGEEIKVAIEKLREQKEIKSIILDLRGNPGGLLEAAVDVTEKFIENKKLIVSVQGRDSTVIDEHYSEEIPIAGNEKMVVLIDGNSASASEIVAGAIQDYDRGVLIGTNSFGKGLVQTVVPVGYNTSLKLTTGKYFTPSGRCIQKVDYSIDNDLFVNKHNDKILEYKTKNGRKVFSKGGIEPDSIFSVKEYSVYFTQLVAGGAFFEYISNLINEYDKNNDSDNFELKLNDDKLLAEFKKFIDSSNFNFQTITSKYLEKFELALSADFSDEIFETVNLLKKQLQNERDRFFKSNKDLILNELKTEFISQTSGRKERIRESLKLDNQFKLALEVLNKPKLYGKFLGN